MSKIIISIKNKSQISLVKFDVTVIFAISSKKGNHFWSHYSWRVVIFGGLLLLAFVNTCESLSLLSRVVALGTLRYIIVGSLHICSIHAMWVTEKLLWKIRETINTCFRVPIAIHMTVTCHTVRAGDNMKNLYSTFIHLMNVRKKMDFSGTLVTFSSFLCITMCQLSLLKLVFWNSIDQKQNTFKVFICI